MKQRLIEADFSKMMDFLDKGNVGDCICLDREEVGQGGNFKWKKETGQGQVTARGEEPFPSRSTWNPTLFSVFINDHNKNTKG